MCHKNLTAEPTPLTLDVNRCAKLSCDQFPFTCKHQKSSPVRCYRDSLYTIDTLILSENDAELSNLGLDITERDRGNPKPKQNTLKNGAGKTNASVNKSANHGKIDSPGINTRNVCRHFVSGKCNRGCCCRFYHPGLIHRAVLSLDSQTLRQKPITPLMDIALQKQRINTESICPPQTSDGFFTKPMNTKAWVNPEFNQSVSLESLNGGLSNIAYEEAGSSIVGEKGLPMMNMSDMSGPQSETKLSVTSQFGPSTSDEMGSNSFILPMFRSLEANQGPLNQAQTKLKMQNPYQGHNYLVPSQQMDACASDYIQQQLWSYPFPTNSCCKRSPAPQGSCFDQGSKRRFACKTYAKCCRKFRKSYEIDTE